MAHHKLTIQPGDTLEVTVDDLENDDDELEDDDDVFPDDDDDEDEDEEDEEDPAEVLKRFPEDLLGKEIERRRRDKDEDN